MYFCIRSQLIVGCPRTGTHAAFLRSLLSRLHMIVNQTRCECWDPVTEFVIVIGETLQ